MPRVTALNAYDRFAVVLARAGTAHHKSWAPDLMDNPNGTPVVGCRVDRLLGLLRLTATSTWRHLFTQTNGEC